MTDTSVSQNLTKNPDPQSKRVFVNDITNSQGQSRLPERPPKSLLEWLVRVHLRLTALEQEERKEIR
jgi:hypothetical protein